MPQTGRDYASSGSIGSSQVVYNAALSSFTDTEITAGITYFYKIFAYDVSFNYASGVQLKGDTTPPANTINNVFECDSSRIIALTWSNPTDADFSKVLILRSTSPIMDAPTTGQSYAGGGSIDSSTVVYNSDLESFQITGDEANTFYYYKLFAYDTSVNYASGVEVSGGGSKANNDDDGLIEIYTAKMLDNMRHEPAGAGYKTSATQTTANTDGCPTPSGCNGYELTADIDLLSLLDTGGVRGEIDETTDADDKQMTVIDITKDESWEPIDSFAGTFEGNNHSIANLWVNVISGNAGLFGTTSGTVVISNVRIISGSIYSSDSEGSFSGGLVGFGATVHIINSYFSGAGGVSSSAAVAPSSHFYSGGLVGSGTTVNITNSYFSGAGGVYSSSSSSFDSYSGGLVGSGSAVDITNSYFSGAGKISSSSSSSSSYSGGLVGSGTTVDITNSYFSGVGGISSSSAVAVASSSGGLVGSGAVMITNGYWDTDAPQSVNGVERILSDKRAAGSSTMNPSGAIGLTLTQLKAITMSTTGAPSPSGLPHSATDNTKAWDLGTIMQLPVVKLCVPTIDMNAMPPTTDWTTCTSYDALLPGQRPISRE